MPERNLDHLERYLLRGEQIVVAVHRHWATVAEPVALALGGLVVAVWLSATLDQRAGQLADLVWWLWFALVGRALFCLWEWQHEWFISTDRRLLLIYGFIVRKVDMMPLGKVTDMTYHRSVPGRLLGYGTFVLESAGQDQALSNLQFIPRPDSTYKAIIAQIFHRDGDEPVEGPDDDYVSDLMEEDDPTRRRFFSAHLGRLVPRGDRDVEGQHVQTGPIRQLREPTRGERFFVDPAYDAAHRGDRSRGFGGAQPRQRDGGERRRGRADHDYVGYDDDDTASLNLGGLGRSGGHTIYRSAEGDGTDAPFYPDSGRDDPTGHWRPR